ncbi:D-2-hydroxyacid dehydrogenase [Alicyclobacillus fastidiosus]|uniref:D-2-hydroxyacid dehydrogenase n=1 Tax=Alicyclobacillus fastidiosus TaxID=392011 RepID=A0ABY6ZBV0_9BACL|nr:D-2-hydroxyacid dehydrogenase [Alicyclobacillus fastidiosus]WAH40332.1 D-2-hydroxyacid dehydrogenase [Alicyclobacillus fastidiosus]GMA61715.1 2-ketoacid reductase [Alicyclobacillus fastidiosus]
MHIKQIVVAGRLNDELEQILSTQREKTFTYVTDDTLTQELLDSSDAFVGFRLVPGLDYHRLKWIHCLGAGVDGVIKYLPGDADTLLTRTTGPFGEKIAEYCLSYMLRDLQHHNAFQRRQESRTWQALVPGNLAGQRVVVLGTGAIGSRVAQVLSFLGASVAGISRRGEQDVHFTRVWRMDEVYKRAIHSPLSCVDWIVNTLPLTPATRHVFDDQFFAACKGAAFINVGRGESVDNEALLRALDAGRIRCAILDVFDQEPLPADSPLWQRRDILITPHISAVTTAQEAADCLLSTLAELERGSAQLSNRVDFGAGY